MNIKNYRLKAGLTQTELAKQMNVHQTAVAQWETGRTAPSIEKLVRLASLFKCSIEDLIKDE